MTKSGMAALSPASAYFMNPNLMVKMMMMQGAEKKSSSWTSQENKIFENALAHVDCRAPDCWAKVAAMLPGKTVRDVISHYRDLEADVTHIEAGLVPFPGYSSSSSSTFTLGWEFDDAEPGCKRPAAAGGRLCDQERKKGVPWTEDEHKLFLMGLKKYGKGDWRNISRNYVVTRTPTQVASHAQKYFIRLNSGGKDKRRASIHDITTVNLPDNAPSSPSTMQSSPDQRAEVAGGFSLMRHGNRFVQLPYGVDPYGIKLEAQDSHNGGGLHDSLTAHHSMII